MKVHYYLLMTRHQNAEQIQNTRTANNYM